MCCSADARRKEQNLDSEQETGNRTRQKEDPTGLLLSAQARIEDTDLMWSWVVAGIRS
jgi:hypothetical protein